MFPKGSSIFNTLVISLLSLGIYVGVASVFGDHATTVEAQNDPFITQRINQIEQRFSMIESRLNRLESDSLRSSMTPRIAGGITDPDLTAIRGQIDGLRSRLGEVECGLLKLDERTLTAAQRITRRKATQGSSEICRQNWGTPIELSSRP